MKARLYSGTSPSSGHFRSLHLQSSPQSFSHLHSFNSQNLVHQRQQHRTMNLSPRQHHKHVIPPVRHSLKVGEEDLRKMEEQRQRGMSKKEATQINERFRAKKITLTLFANKLQKIINRHQTLLSAQFFQKSKAPRLSLISTPPRAISFKDIGQLQSTEIKVLQSSEKKREERVSVLERRSLSRRSRSIRSASRSEEKKKSKKDQGLRMLQRLFRRNNQRIKFKSLCYLRAIAQRVESTGRITQQTHLLLNRMHRLTLASQTLGNILSSSKFKLKSWALLFLYNIRQISQEKNLNKKSKSKLMELILQRHRQSLHSGFFAVWNKFVRNVKQREGISKLIQIRVRMNRYFKVVSFNQICQCSKFKYLRLQQFILTLSLLSLTRLKRHSFRLLQTPPLHSNCLIEALPPQTVRVSSPEVVRALPTTSRSRGQKEKQFFLLFLKKIISLRSSVNLNQAFRRIARTALRLHSPSPSPSPPPTFISVFPLLSQLSPKPLLPLYLKERQKSAARGSEQGLEQRGPSNVIKLKTLVERQVQTDIPLCPFVQTIVNEPRPLKLGIKEPHGIRLTLHREVSLSPSTRLGIQVTPKPSPRNSTHLIDNSISSINFSKEVRTEGNNLAQQIALRRSMNLGQSDKRIGVRRSTRPEQAGFK